MMMEEERKLRLRNHAKAYDYMLSCIAQGKAPCEEVILKSHEILLDGLAKHSGVYRTGSEKPMFIRGTRYEPPAGKDVQRLMKRFWEDIEMKRSLLGMPEFDMTVIDYAAYAHAEFESIHPFSDGNGRTGRFLLNYILIENGFFPINIMREREQEYFACLQAYHNSNSIADISRNYSLLSKFIYDEEYEMIQSVEQSPEKVLQRYLQYDREI